MKLARVQPTGSRPIIGILEDDSLWLTHFSSPLQALTCHMPIRKEKSLSWQNLIMGVEPRYRLLSPIAPPEVWAYGFTYQRGPQFFASPVLPSGPSYSAAVNSNRPEIFFKTTGFRVVGHNEKIGIRGDSSYTAVEAELCLILDKQMAPVLFTIGNDVSAWDIEARNPLYLTQCKTFEACCSLGPIAITRDEMPEDPEIHCYVFRGDKELFHGSISLHQMRWSYEELAQFASAFNPLPEGTVLMTGTAIIRPDSNGLTDGDVVKISIDGIGTLVNTARLLKSPAPFLPY